jgi:hypothetical protein
MAKPAMPALKLRQAGHQIGLFPLTLTKYEHWKEKRS